MTTYFDKAGLTYDLPSKLIGGGGEAEVYEVIAQPNIVAKIYHATESPQSMNLRYQKLNLMLNNPVSINILSSSIAWPQQLLYDQAGKFIGYTMQKGSNYAELHQAYSPKYRKRLFPKWNAGELALTVATNVAACLDAVHSAGYVIGDINPRNFLVDRNGHVTLVDCDSFQVSDPKNPQKPFLCTVTFEGYLAPELCKDQIWEPVKHARNQQHDLFALGTLIFQILMDGRHPFSGQWTDVHRKDPLMNEKIAQGYYIFSPNQNKNLAPQQCETKMQTLDDRIVALIRNCFVTGQSNPNARPSGQTWRTELQAVNNTNYLFRAFYKALSSDDDQSILVTYTKEVRTNSRLKPHQRDRAEAAVRNRVNALEFAATWKYEDEVGRLWNELNPHLGTNTLTQQTLRYLSELVERREIVLSLAIESDNPIWMQWAHSRLLDKQSFLNSAQQNKLNQALNSLGKI